MMNLNIKAIPLDLGFDNPQIKNSPTVFIGKITLGKDELHKLESKIPRELYLFGAVVKTGEIHFHYGEVKRLELVAIEINLETNETTQHFLAQNDSVMFKRKQDPTDFECADMIKKKDILFLHRAPRWKVSEASIPKYDNKLFYFSTQFYIPENEVNKKYLGWGETIFVFLFVTEQDELLIQIYEEDTSEQSAEEHYKLEEMMMEFDACYNIPEKVHRLIEKGDKYFHEYVLEHKRINRKTLESLLIFAKTKKMKDEITKRLK
jgi:hypothetical protein